MDLETVARREMVLAIRSMAKSVPFASIADVKTSPPSWHKGHRIQHGHESWRPGACFSLLLSAEHSAISTGEFAETTAPRCCEAARPWTASTQTKMPAIKARARIPGLGRKSTMRPRERRIRAKSRKTNEMIDEN
jgi:hypothetical protein